MRYRYTDEPSIGDLFSHLSQQMSTLVQQEVQLAKVEMSQKTQKAAKDVTILAVGAVTAYVGVLALVAMLILALAEVMAAWLAALLVGLVFVGIGAALVVSGINKLKALNPKPERTIETMKENKEWLSHQLN